MSKAAELAALIGSQSALSNRNMIINGAMQVAQRGTSFSPAADNTYVVDRFRVKRNGMDNLVYDLSQSSTSPDGFANSIKLDVTTAETSSADNEYLKIDTAIEAQNVQQLKYGTSSAEQITMSFWVRSSTTGTYAIEMYTEDSGNQITNTYTVNSANTWEYKTVTFVGDTSGSINNDNGRGFLISWFLSVPSNYKTGDSTSWRTYNADGRGYNQTADVASTTGEFYITGIQLEVGEQATPFEHRSYGDELKKCERYYQQLKALQTSSGTQTTQVLGVYQAATAMRASATVGSSGALQVTDYGNTSKTQSSANISLQHSGNNDFSNRYYPIRLQNFSGLNTHRLWQLYNNSNYIDLDAEL